MEPTIRNNKMYNNTRVMGYGYVKAHAYYRDKAFVV